MEKVYIQLIVGKNPVLQTIHICSNCYIYNVQRKLEDERLAEPPAGWKLKRPEGFTQLWWWGFRAWAGPEEGLP